MFASFFCLHLLDGKKEIQPVQSHQLVEPSEAEYYISYTPKGYDDAYVHGSQMETMYFYNVYAKALY